jgi:TetR/AcrR family transcriptional repressor of nem operon
MARPRSYDPASVLVAAKQVFWKQGYEGTSISDLETATGLSRSSLYQAFGTKRDLFDAALDEYRRSFVDARLGPVERDGAGLSEAAGFFLALARLFRQAGSQQGCLQVNSMTELAGRDPDSTRQGAGFADRYRSAFSHALTAAAAQGAMDHQDVARRSELLTAAAIGVWIAVRLDQRAAAATCRAVASEIQTWAPTP